MSRLRNGTWAMNLAAKWPNLVQLAPTGLFDDLVLGDVDLDGVLDRLPPNTLFSNFLNLSAPPYPHAAYHILVDESSMHWFAKPVGSAAVSLALFLLLALLPIATGLLSVYLFRRRFHAILLNRRVALSARPV